MKYSLIQSSTKIRQVYKSIVINNSNSRLWSFISGNSFGLKTKRKNSKRETAKRIRDRNNVCCLLHYWRRYIRSRCCCGWYSQSYFASSNMKTSLVVSWKFLIFFKKILFHFKFELNCFGAVLTWINFEWKYFVDFGFECRCGRCCCGWRICATCLREEIRRLLPIRQCAQPIRIRIRLQPR